MGVPCREGESLVLLSPVVRVSAASFVLQKEGRREECLLRAMATSACHEDRQRVSWLVAWGSHLEFCSTSNKPDTRPKSGGEGEVVAI